MKRAIALVAHDGKKADLVEWTLALHVLYATGATGRKITEKNGLKIKLLKDGSHGGDMEIGAPTHGGRKIFVKTVVATIVRF